MFTRKDYLASPDQEYAHTRYYQEIISENDILVRPSLVMECAALLKMGDTYFSKVSPMRWDNLIIPIMNNFGIKRSLRIRGDSINPTIARSILHEVILLKIKKITPDYFNMKINTEEITA